MVGLKGRGKRQRSVLLAGTLLFLGFFCCSPSYALSGSELSISEVKVETKSERELELSATAHIAMSQEQMEIIYNGIPLTFIYEIRVKEPKPLGFKRTRLEERLRYQLKYHALSKQFIVKDLVKKRQTSHPTLSLALGEVAKVRKKRLKFDESFEKGEGSIRLWLDIEALPAPLRIPTYLSKNWHLNSGWFYWELPQ